MDLPGLNQYYARINVLAQGHNAVTPVRLEPAAPRSGVKHSTTEPLRSHYSNVSLPAKMEKILYGMHKLVGPQLFWSGTPTFSSGTPTFCQMGVLNSCFQNPSESSESCILIEERLQRLFL